MSFNIPFSSGGGGVFVPTFHSGRRQISSGASGTLVTLTPPAGERVRITMYSTETVGSDTNMQLNVAGSQIVVGTMSASTSAVGYWCISAPGASTSALQNNIWSGYIPEVTGGIDEVITVVKTSGTTGETHYYGYQFGDLK